MIRLNRPPRLGVRTLGYGSRAAIWLQGCSIACEGCASRDTWDPALGDLVPIDEVVAALTSSGEALDGLTITGGEPFQQAAAVADLVSAVRSRYDGADFDVLCFTGYSLARARRRAPDLVAALDVLVDGRFRADLPTELPLRGSANQEVHLLTSLAAERYRAIDGARRPPLQFELSDDGLELIGIPLPGELARLETALAARGFALDEVSWR